MNCCDAFMGECLALVQSADTPGPITITAESEGLRRAVIQLERPYDILDTPARLLTERHVDA